MTGFADRKTAERELTKLIERALRSVPYVRLDVVQEITQLFEVAINTMESNLEDEDSDDERSPLQRNEQIKKKAFERLKRVMDVDCSSDDGREEFKEKPHNKFVRPVDGKRSGVTKDYSSPSLGKRRLNIKKKPAGNSSRAAHASGITSGFEDGNAFEQASSRSKMFKNLSDDTSGSDEDGSFQGPCSTRTRRVLQFALIRRISFADRVRFLKVVTISIHI